MIIVHEINEHARREMECEDERRRRRRVPVQSSFSSSRPLAMDSLKPRKAYRHDRDEIIVSFLRCMCGSGASFDHSLLLFRTIQFNQSPVGLR